jgi:hypothetical protein
MVTQEYHSNSAPSPQSDLANYQRAWVAVSSEGSRIVARGKTSGELEEHVLASGAD